MAQELQRLEEIQYCLEYPDCINCCVVHFLTTASSKRVRRTVLYCMPAGRGLHIRQDEPNRVRAKAV